MRKYTPKNDVQKKSYYNDRFFVTPELPREYIENNEVFLSDSNVLKAKFDIAETFIQQDHMIVILNNFRQNKEVVGFMKNALGYDMLMELSAVDYIASRGGFEIFYEMLSMSKHTRARVKCFIKEHDAIDSVEAHFRSADWSEREMYDMYGVKINNHPFMKRILMPDDWNDYPLRKTYPLQGDEAAQWYEVDKIFGREYRDVIGPEIRDAAAIDRYDTTRFARLGHEVPYGTDISQGEPDTPLGYQEEGGVRLFGARIVSKLEESESKTLKERR